MKAPVIGFIIIRSAVNVNLFPARSTPEGLQYGLNEDFTLEFTNPFRYQTGCASHKWVVQGAENFKSGIPIFWS